MTAAPGTPKSTKAATSRPMKLFLSYGRDGLADEARALRDALLARGHEVWFDEQRLGVGLDWEHSIEMGLNECDRVVLLMTTHSVRRTDGFCLNELAKALQLGKIIIPVLLEEVPLGAPTSICRIQYLDWRDAVPASVHSERFDRHLGRLCEAIEEDKLDFEGGQQRLHHLLQPINFDSDIRPHMARFQGRQQLLIRLRNWAQDLRGSQILWLSAAPGLGKTAVAAQLAHHYPEFVAMHFCVAGHQDKADPARVILSIAYQLSTKLEAYRVRLESQDLAQEVKKNAKTVFDNLLVRPFSVPIQRPSHPCVVLVDGLDEATAEDGTNELANILGENWSRLPDWLRLMVSSRPEAEIATPFAASVEHIAVEANDPEQQADLGTFLHEQLTAIGRPPSTETLRRIVELSEGAFIYAVRLVEDVREGRCNPENPAELPAGLGQFYHQTFRRRFPQRHIYNTECAPLLSLVLAAPEPVPLGVLAEVVGADAWEVRQRLQLLGSMLEIEAAADPENLELKTVRFAHASLRSWLTKSDTRTGTPVAGHFSVRRNVPALAKVMLARWDAQTGNNKEGADGPEGFVARSLWTLLEASKDDSNKERIALEYSEYWKERQVGRALGPAKYSVAVYENDSSNVKLLRDEFARSAKCYRNYGRILLHIGETKTAAHQYQSALNACQQYLIAFPKNSFWLVAYSASLSDVGLTMEQMGHPDEAIDKYKKSLEISLSMLEEQRNSERWKRELSVAYNNIGRIMHSRWNFDEALRMYYEDLAIAEELAKSDPTNCTSQQDLAITLGAIGEVLKSQGNLAGALEKFTKAHEIIETLMADDPATIWVSELCGTHTKIGDALKSQKNYEDAMMHFEKAAKISKEFSEGDALNVSWKMRLSGVYCRIGDTMLGLNRIVEALAIYKEALDITEQISACDTENKEWQSELVRGINRCGFALISLQDFEGAIPYFFKSLSLTHELHDDDRQKQEAIISLRTCLLATGSLAMTDSNVAEHEPSSTEAAKNKNPEEITELMKVLKEMPR